MVTKTAATTFGDLSLSSSGFVVDVNGEHMQTYYQGQCFGAFQLSHRELTTEGIFFFFDKWIYFHLKLWDGHQGVILASVLNSPNSVLASLVLCIGVNQEQPGMSDKHNSKHYNLGGVFSMWHLDIFTVYIQLF